MREIGLIKLVQIQRSSLKQGQRPQRYYDPTPLLVVERLLLAAPGSQRRECGWRTDHRCASCRPS